MQIALQLLVTTLQIGAVYVLFSLGLTLIFGIMRVVNFVHGHFFAVSALMVSVLVPKVAASGFSVQSAYLIAALGAIAVSGSLALVVYKLGLAYFLRDMEGAFILTMGMALFLDGVFDILVVEQNAEIALAIADRAHILEEGSVVADEDAKALARSEDVQRAYLGI